MSNISNLLMAQDPDAKALGMALAASRPEFYQDIYRVEDKSALERVLNLDFVQCLLDHNPQVSIGGSTGLILMGSRITRKVTNNSLEFDVNMPYYQPLDLNFANDPNGSGILEHPSSGQDVAQTIEVTHDHKRFTIDTFINPQTTWKYIPFNGYKYRVTDPLVILEAKIKYARHNDKHRQDILDLLGYINYMASLKEKYVPDPNLPF